jgi:murein L,D-transpeptidase YcbB/YkuD
VPHQRSVDLLVVLQDALEKNDIEQSLKRLVPRHPTYAQMRKELASFRQIAASGGWPAFPGGPKLKRGSHGWSVALLKRRLIVAGDLTADVAANPERFDGNLEMAVRKYQWRHGLAPTGIVDQETRHALNIPVERRIRQIEINMERWRWLPDDFGPRYVMTIIPDFWLYVVDDQKTILSMKTVIGTRKQPSPVFSDDMSYVELNPTWGLPLSIIAKEIIPKVRKDGDYLSKKRIRIYENWSEKAREIDPKKINWAKINPEKFPYRMIQDPGVNPLGRIKFMFPNEFDVYLHDTTQKSLFQKHRRLYSHGCIRIEKPYDLGEWVLRDDPSWSRKRILGEIKKGKRLQVSLPRTVPVHVMYLTAWVDGNGFLQFREDYYGYDTIYEETLKILSRRMGNRLSLRGGNGPIGIVSPKQ